jgi:hypothetical protein
MFSVSSGPLTRAGGRLSPRSLLILLICLAGLVLAAAGLLSSPLISALFPGRAAGNPAGTVPGAPEKTILPEGTATPPPAVPQPQPAAPPAAPAVTPPPEPPAPAKAGAKAGDGGDGLAERVLEKSQREAGQPPARKDKNDGTPKQGGEKAAPKEPPGKKQDQTPPPSGTKPPPPDGKDEGKGSTEAIGAGKTPN